MQFHFGRGSRPGARKVWTDSMLTELNVNFCCCREQRSCPARWSNPTDIWFVGGWNNMLSGLSHVRRGEALSLSNGERSSSGFRCHLNETLFQQYGCNFVIKMSDKTFDRLEHYKMHEDQQRLTGPPDWSSDNNNLSPSPNPTPETQPVTQTYPTGTTLTTVDGLPVFKRKRGRPPKNRVEVSYRRHKIWHIYAITFPNSRWITIWDLWNIQNRHPRHLRQHRPHIIYPHHFPSTYRPSI